MASNHKQRCSICRADLILETTDVPDKWPRELSYICPNGHGRHIVVELKDPKSMPAPAPTDPNIPIKRVYKPDARQEEQMELYYGAGAVRRKIGQSDPKTHDYLNQLEVYINGAIIQYHRIQEDHNLSTRAFKELWKGSLDPPRIWEEKLGPTNLTLFLDIHFYLICLDKIDKLYPQFLSHFASLGKGAQDNTARRIQRKLVQRKFEQALSQIKDARDFREHIEDKIRKGEFGGFGHEVNKNGHRFIYGKKKRRLSIDLKPITDAYETLIGMLRSLADLD